VLSIEKIRSKRRGRGFAQPKDAIRQSFETAPLKNCALHKFTPQRLQGKQFFNLAAREIHDFSIT
jgi:hypothetical protein